MSVLKDSFSPISKKRAKEQGISEDEPRYVSRLSRDIEACGSMDKVALGMCCHCLDANSTLTSISQGALNTMRYYIGTTRLSTDT